MNVQKIVNDANILIAAMPFSFLLRWDEKVCDGTFLGTGQGSDGKRLGLGEKFRRLQEAEFFFCATWLNAWTLCAFDHHYLIMLHLTICSPFGLCHFVQRASFIFSLIEHLICWSIFEARRVSAVCRSHHTAFSYHDGGRSNSVWSHWKIMKG